jgi:hypothetical protein
MQLISSYLYPNKLDVYTSAPDWNNLRYNKVYNRNLKIYRSVDNRIDLQVRNCDQKAYDLTTVTLESGQTLAVIFNIITREGKNLVLSKECDNFLLADESTSSLTKGQVRATLTITDIANLEPGYYNYTIVQEIRNTISPSEHTVVSRTVLYADSQFGAISTLEVLDDVLGQVEQSLEVSAFKLIDPRARDNRESEFYVSSIIDTNRNIQTAQSLHTFQIYCTNYTGRVQIEGSLDNDSDPSNWVTIRSRDVVDETMFYENITGKYNWFRVRHSTDTSGDAKFVVGQSTNGSYAVSLYDGGSSYTVGDVITIIGSVLGGANGVNDLNITVTAVNYLGSIVSFTYSGTSISGVRSFVLNGTGISSSGIIDKILYR